MSLPTLPSDLIKEIFSYLPVKPLVRFTSVSKHYKSLIFDSEFIKLHLQRSPKHTHVLLTFCGGETLWVLNPCSVRHLLEHPPSIVNEDDCRSFKNYYYYYTIGSTNGLVCLIGKVQNDEVIRLCVRFWNPTLRLRSKKSPTLTMSCDDFHIGFGYDDSIDTYKVVALFWDLTTEKWEARVHCMGDSFWRETRACLEFPVNLESAVGSFVNGSVNWLAWLADHQSMIFSLDLHKETSKCLLLPAGFDGRHHNQTDLAVLRGCLCFFYDDMRTHFVLWEMREFGVQDSWTRLVNISYGHLQFDNIQHDWLLVPVCVSENEDVLLLVSKLVPGDIIMYNRKDGRVEHIELPDTHIWFAREHMQSLVVPHPHPH